MTGAGPAAPAEGPHPEMRNGHDELGNVVCARAERGGVTTIQYDTTATYPRIVKNPLGHETETLYYGIDTVPIDFGLYGQVKYVIDPNLAMAEVRYDALGRKVREVVPGATTADGTSLDLAITTWSYLTYAADGRQYARTEVHAKPGPISAIGTLDVTSRVEWSESYLDGAEREVKLRRPGADGKVVVKVRRLDARGAVVSQSDPFFEVAPLLAIIMTERQVRRRPAAPSGPKRNTCRSCPDSDVQSPWPALRFACSDRLDLAVSRRRALTFRRRLAL